MATAEPSRAGPSTGAEPPRHRACDECRTRKLACSKEPDGCARCKREGLVCIYSPQKPMGRPRKRPPMEVAPGGEGEPEAGPSSAAQGAQGALDLDLSFLDPDVPDLSFLEILEQVSSNIAAPHGGQQQPPLPPLPQLQQRQQPQHQQHHQGLLSAAPIPHKGGWHFEMPSIDFSSPVPSEAPDPSTAHSQSHSPSSAGSHTGHEIPQTCDCIANLHLALASLQNLPGEFGPAVRAIRHASRTAYEAAVCPVCAPPEDVDIDADADADPSADIGAEGGVDAPLLQSFRNIMLVAVLVTALAGAYEHLLGLIDAEVARAEEARRQLVFSLDECGGFWGALAAHNDGCGAAAYIDGSSLDPPVWRLTMRILLKVDLYGVPAPSAAREPAENSCLPDAQLGLKDVLKCVEARARAWEGAIDAAIASGLVEDLAAQGYVRLPAGEAYSCMPVVYLAGDALIELVIP